MADAQASGACYGNIVWVQVPSSADQSETEMFPIFCVFFCIKKNTDHLIGILSWNRRGSNP